MTVIGMLPSSATTTTTTMIAGEITTATGIAVTTMMTIATDIGGPTIVMSVTIGTAQRATLTALPGLICAKETDFA